MESPPLVTVNIRSIAVGGEGVGEVVSQIDGKNDLLGIATFIPFTIPGEIVSARIVEHKKRYLKADLLQVESPVDQRVIPPCQYFGICGGCELQHIAYEGQLQAKMEMILGALRAARLGQEVIEHLLPIVSGKPYHYRRRVTLHVDTGGKVGFYRTKSRSVVPLKTCLIAIPELAEPLLEIQTFGSKIAGKISSLLLEADTHGLIAVLKAPYPLRELEKEQVLLDTRQYFQNALLMVGEKEVGGFGRQILELPLNSHQTLLFRVPAGAFSQVNWEVNLALIERIVELSRPPFAKRVYDLFAGAGNFAIPVARAGAQVIAVECDHRLVTFGRENILFNRLDTHLDFVDSSVEKFLSSDSARNGADVIIADPPRSGLGALCAQLPPAKRLLLISCHLPSCVRDIRMLTEQGWKVVEIRPFDMFSQTSYIEVLTVFERV